MKVQKKDKLNFINFLINIFFIFIVIFLLWSNLFHKKEIFASEKTSQFEIKKNIINIMSREIYDKISSSAYDTDVDFGRYVEKFYRDARIMGITPDRPKTMIIKFSPIDRIGGLAHIHGLSFGIDDDERIEIYINPSTWENFNKPMRYVLMYHELAHDVLNLKDLELTESNEGMLLMHPGLSDFRSFTMDEFINSYKNLFLLYILEN